MTEAFRQVQRELQRARAARRLVPFVLASGVVGAALVAWMGRSGRAALVVLGACALFLAFVAAAATPRCPQCAGSLWRRGESPGSAAAPRQTQVERERRCPRCGARFE